MIESPGHPLKTALICGGVFFTAGVFYILFSSHISALAAATVPDLASIEKFKGLLFIAFTSLLLFFIIYAMLLRINRQHRRLLNFGNRLIAAERRAAALVVADSAAREIGSLLMAIEYYIQELSDTAPNEKSEALQRVTTAQIRLKKLARNLAAATGRQAKKEYFDLAAAVREAISFARSHRSLNSCTIEFTGTGEIMFMGNLLLIYQAILNLLLNAADATASKGDMRVDLSDIGDFLVIEVHDNGLGISAAMRSMVMEPFYTTKENGSGVGLLSVLACARAHDGDVEIRDSDMGGACFAVRLKKAPAVIDD
jgi:two-component system sensor histidine kinase HydH